MKSRGKPRKREGSRSRYGRRRQGITRGISAQPLQHLIWLPSCQRVHSLPLHSTITCTPLLSIDGLTMDPSSTCYSIIHDDLLESPNAAELRNALQKGSDEVKLETMRRIIVGTLNGHSYVRLPQHMRATLTDSRNSSCRSYNM